MGCYVTALLKPQNLHKTILLSIPDQSTDTLKVRIKQRLLDRCGQFNEAGISTYPRSSGQVQNIGPSFWQVMDQLDPLKEITSLAQITQLHIIHPRSDEIVDTSNIQAYRLIHSINYYEIPGNHSFTNHTNRKQLIKKIQQIVKS